MSPIYLDAQSADQTSTDAEADIAETEVNLPEGYLPTLRALNTGGSNAVDVTPYVKFRRENAAGNVELSDWVQIAAPTELSAGEESLFEFEDYAPLCGAIKLTVASAVGGSHSDVAVSGLLRPLSMLEPRYRVEDDAFSGVYFDAQSAAQASTNDFVDIAESEIAIPARSRGMAVLLNSGSDDVTVQMQAQYIAGNTPTGWIDVPTNSAIVLGAGVAQVFDADVMCPSASRIKFQIESTVDDTPGDILAWGAAFNRAYLKETLSGAYDPTS